MKKKRTSISSPASADSHSRPTPSLQGFVMSSATTNHSRKQSSKSTGRLLFLLSPLTRRTKGSGSGLLLTPTVTNIEGGEERVAKRTAYRESIGRKYVAGGLAEQMTRMLPTPRTSDSEGGEVKNVEYNGSWSRVNRDGTRHGIKTKDAIGAIGMKLQPAFALWMMGFPEDWCDLEDGEMPLSKQQAMRSSRR